MTTGTGRLTAAQPVTTRADREPRIAFLSLGLAVLALVITLFTFRGLVYLTLPASLLAMALGAWGTVSATRPAYRLVAYAGFVLGLLLLLTSLAAAAVALNIADSYDVYERR